MRGETEIQLRFWARQREGRYRRILRRVHKQDPSESADQVGVFEVELIVTMQHCARQRPPSLEAVDKRPTQSVIPSSDVADAVDQCRRLVEELEHGKWWFSARAH